MRIVVFAFLTAAALSVARGSVPAMGQGPHHPPPRLHGASTDRRWGLFADAHAVPAYTPALSGAVVASRLSGVEPDGDPLYQVVLKTRLGTSGGTPALNLIVSSYLESFQPDTTPILPDLLHPNQNAQNLGGFLQGKALLTDDAGTVMSIGSFVAEAFLDNSNHVAMTLTGSGASFGISGKLLGSFVLHKGFSLSGGLHGQLTLPAAARRRLLAHRGARMKPLKSIIDVVTVKPHPMVGLSNGSAPGTPLPSGFVSKPSSPGSSTHVNPLSIVAAVGAVLSLLLAGVLYMMERQKRAAKAELQDPTST